MTTRTKKYSTTNNLKVGDRVIDFRGELTGTVASIEINRGGGRSDKVEVLLDEGGRSWNYCDVWRRA